MAQLNKNRGKTNTENTRAANPRQKSSFGKIALFAVLASAVVILAATLIAGNSGNRSEADGNAGAVVKDSDLVIRTSEITEKASFYPVEIDGTALEVLAVRAPDNTVRTAFNTCQVCYGSGRGYYVQEGNALVCQNCGNRFGMDDVEVTRGGCNPVPITDADKTVSDTEIIISEEFLAEAKNIFSNWKV